MILFGVNAIIYKVAPQIGPVTLALISFVISALTTFIYWLFFVQEAQASWQGIGVGMIAGVVSAVALITFIAALQLGKAGVVNTIRALSAGVTVLLAITFLSEKLTLLQIAGVVFGIISVILLSL